MVIHLPNIYTPNYYLVLVFNEHMSQNYDFSYVIVINWNTDDVLFFGLAVLHTKFTDQRIEI